MTRIIRKSIFETNSSSSHSITLSHTTKLVNSLHVNKQNKIVATGGEFGWEEHTFVDATTKLNYLVARIYTKHFYDLLKSEKIELTKTESEWLHKVKKAVYDFTKKKLIIKQYKTADGGLSLGYIDHQSMEVAEKILNSTIGRIQHFIFNPKSKLCTGNDNH